MTILAASASFELATQTVRGRALPALLLAFACGLIVLYKRPTLGVPVFVALGATVFALPFHRVSIVGIRSDIPELLALGLISGWVARMVIDHESPRGPYVAPTLLVVFGALIGTVVAGLHGVGRQELQGGLKPYLIYLIALVLAGTYKTDVQQQALEKVVLWLGTAGSLWVLFQAATGGAVAADSDTQLFTLGQSFAASRYRPPLLNLLPLAVMLIVGQLALRGWSLTRVAQLIVFVATIGLGYNRSSWLPIGLSAVLVAILVPSPRQAFAALRLVVVLALVVPGAYAAADAGALGSTGRAISARLSSTINPDVLKENSYQDRASENRDALKALSRSPVFGVGVAGIYGARRAIYRADLGRFQYVDRTFMHNSYLFAWLQTGLIGIAGIALLGVRILATAARSIQELAPEQTCRVLASALALLAYALSAIFQPYVLSRPAITAVCFALALAQQPTDARRVNTADRALATAAAPSP